MHKPNWSEFNSFVKGIIILKFLVLKDVCPGLKWDQYWHFLTNIMFARDAKLSRMAIMERLDHLNINSLMEYLNSHNVTKAAPISELADILCKNSTDLGPE